MDPVPGPPPPAPDANTFHDVPLTTLPKNTLGSVQAVPQYETPAEIAAARGEASYSDEKLGFAGQRSYGSALKVDTAPSLRKSDYVEYDVKH